MQIQFLFSTSTGCMPVLLAYTAVQPAGYIEDDTEVTLKCNSKTDGLRRAMQGTNMTCTLAAQTGKHA